MEKKMVGNNNLIDTRDIKKTFQTIGKNWYWFVLFLLLGVGGSIAYLYKATKFYGATTQVLITPPKDPFKDALSESLPNPTTKSEEVNNEIMVLRSTKLMDETIKKLGLGTGKQ